MAEQIAMIGFAGGAGAAEVPFQALMDAEEVSQSVDDLETAEKGFSVFENTITASEFMSGEKHKDKCGK